ncbi:unnamed protein product [Arctia plantaginis]|uniref:Uncharacterized protein n=1 Tax=Arctia plantaginis TaxID=874455 RepID=A0A8S0ZDZ9_ARCPL|nr:unnamed protein product [Arctia plantaginis]CAB3234962.1 unnamed protein product [Arctia plantaginis]
MKTFIILCTLAVVVFGRPEDHYTDKYDTINLDEILDNRRLLEPYIKCGLELGKCSPEGKELKSHIKEALETYCEKCTKAQQSGTRRVIAHLINKEPQYWKQLTAKYDKDNKYTAKYEAELKIIKVM